MAAPRASRICSPHRSFLLSFAPSTFTTRPEPVDRQPPSQRRAFISRHSLSLHATFTFSQKNNRVRHAFCPDRFTHTPRQVSPRIVFRSLANLSRVSPPIPARPSCLPAHTAATALTHHSNRPTAGLQTALVLSRLRDLPCHDSHRSPSAASTLISRSSLATRVNAHPRTLSVSHYSLRPSITSSCESQRRSCSCPFRPHVWLPLDRLVCSPPEPTHWTWPALTTFTCHPKLHIPPPPNAQARPNLPARSLSHSSYGHRLIPLSTH
ncbi:hypothetical protein BDW02DRAFT_93106 [Decorospora gaudefroyi]|uniref:Uncharacterized protein n=1 Tax=Decorospora gaudefroyi TaxID=184978 RepID=A0A6A5K3E3_9PLEO|nr:hypothetical protein BDW02DRAFT_93106 [Decorospora gaudefroyi]